MLVIIKRIGKNCLLRVNQKSSQPQKWAKSSPVVLIRFIRITILRKRKHTFLDITIYKLVYLLLIFQRLQLTYLLKLNTKLHKIQKRIQLLIILFLQTKHNKFLKYHQDTILFSELHALFSQQVFSSSKVFTTLIILFLNQSGIPSEFVIQTVISINSDAFFILLLSRFLFPLVLKYELF